MKVLLVVDERLMQKFFCDTFKHLFGEQDTTILVAESLREARVFTERPLVDLDLILIDSRLGPELTFGLIPEIKLVYGGPLVAISADEYEHPEKIRLGCTHASNRDIFDFLSKRKFEIANF